MFLNLLKSNRKLYSKSSVIRNLSTHLISESPSSSSFSSSSINYFKNSQSQQIHEPDDFVKVRRDSKTHLRKVDLKKFSYINFKDLEHKNQIINHFNESILKLDSNTFLRELDYYLNYEATDVKIVNELYEQLPGSIKNNSYAIRSFLKYYKKKDSPNFFKVLKNSNFENLDAESYCIVIDQLLSKKIRDFILLDKMVKRLKLIIDANPTKPSLTSKEKLNEISNSGDDDDNNNEDMETHQINNYTRGILVRYYIEIGDMSSAEGYLKTCSPNDGYPVDTFILYLKTLLNVSPHRALEFVEQIISKFDQDFSQPFNIIRIIDVFKQEKKDKEIFQLWDFIDQKELKSNQIYTINNLRYELMFEYLILIEKDIVMAKLLFEKTLKNPEISDFKKNPKLGTCIVDPFFKYYFRESNYGEIEKLLKLSRSKNIVLNPQIVYHVFFRSGMFDLNKIIVAMIVDRSFVNTLGWIVAYLEKNESESNRKLIDQIIQTLISNQRYKSGGVTEIIKTYLFLDDFQKAIQWYTSKQSLFNITPELSDFHFFLRYHQKKGENDLIEFWYNSIEQFGMNRKSHAGKDVAQFQAQLFNNTIDYVEAIGKWLNDDGNSLEERLNQKKQVVSKQLKSIEDVQKQLFEFQQSKGSNKTLPNFSTVPNLPTETKTAIPTQAQTPPTTTLPPPIQKTNIIDIKEIELLIQRNDLTKLKIKLIEILEKNSSIANETLTRVLDIIYLNDPEGYMDYIGAIIDSDSIDPIELNAYSSIIKTDLEEGLRIGQFSASGKFNQKDTIFLRSSPIWSSILIFSIRKGYIKESFRLMATLREKKIQITPQAIYLVGLECINIIFRSQGIPFNFTTNTDIFFFNDDKNSDDYSKIFKIQKSFKQTSNYYLYGKEDENLEYHMNNPKESPRQFEERVEVQKRHNESIQYLNQFIKDNKVEIFRLYQAYVLEAPVTNLPTSSSSLFYRYYYIPITNLCISLLIDVGDVKNTKTLIDRAFSTNTFNRQTLLLFLKSKQVFKSNNNNNNNINNNNINNNNINNNNNNIDNNNEKEEEYNQIKSIIQKYSKFLSITNDELNQLLNNPDTIFQDYQFIRDFLKKPKHGEDIEIRNNYLSIDLLKNNNLKSRIGHLIDSLNR